MLDPDGLADAVHDLCLPITADDINDAIAQAVTGLRDAG